ncbi:MAG TPA: ATP-binding protein, partial [Urbifossiella sp.]|nr:ATP-binding protein [Urbifossiella sp.]
MSVALIQSAFAGATTVDFDLKNKVRQTDLGRSQGLRPIFEAIANAFDAIADGGAKPPTGAITVRVLRGDTDRQNLPLTGQTLRPVVGFEIHDDGVGFNDEQHGSFKKAYSAKKATTGGKGCGRFLWLKAFESIEVESHFATAAGGLEERCFTFDPENEVVPYTGAKYKTTKQRGSVVRLTNFKSGFKCPLQSGTIARHIIEHCLEQMFASERVELVLDDD